MVGAALVMVLARRDTHNVLKLVDWHLLLFFAALFAVVGGLNDRGLPDTIYSRLQPMFGSSAAAQAWNLAWFSVAGSNVFSNVPFVLVAGNWIARFIEPTLMWKVLALATTFAGNLTIVGSVANMIVVESARDHPGQFLRLCSLRNPKHGSNDRGRRGYPACFALRRACAARRWGDGIATSSIESNQCCMGAILFGSARLYTTSATR